MGKSNQRRIALAAISVIVTSGALWFVFRSFDWSGFRQLATHLDPLWLVAAVAADVLSYVCQGARWQRLLRPLRSVSLFTTTRAIYAGLFMNEVLPLRPGEILRGLIVARETRYPTPPLLRSMVAERWMDAVILIVAALIATIYTPLPHEVALFLQAAAFAVVLAIGIATSARGRIPAHWLAPFRNPGAFVISTGVFLGQAVAVWCILQACAIPLSFGAAFSITAILRIGTALPLAPANIGTHQVAAIAGLTIFGVERAQAASASIILFAVLTLPLLALGALAFLHSQVALHLNLSFPIPQEHAD